MINKIKKFKPSVFPSVIGTVLFSLLSLLTVTTSYGKLIPDAILYILYVGAFAFITMMIWSIIIRRTDIYKGIYNIFHRRKFFSQLWDDYSFRTITFGYISLMVNVVFAISKGFAGWYFSSMWMMALSAYYLLLCITKFLLLRNHRRLEMHENQNVRLVKEWEIVRVCGTLFILLTLVLQALVIMIVKDGNSFAYQGVLIYAVAAYDFYCLIISILYMLRMRKKHSPAIVAIKSISFATSLVAILSLQTAMFASFGNQINQIDNQRLLNLLTGTAVCIMIAISGIVMLVTSKKKINTLKSS